MANNQQGQQGQNQTNRNGGAGMGAQGSKGGQKSAGNFKNDPERAAEAGRKGGQASHNGSQTGNRGGTA